MAPFIFNDQVDVKEAHRAELPRGIFSTDVLLDALSFSLRFPDYFGQNWNALDECLQDLSWLPPGDVALIHRDLPLAKDGPSCLIYLSTLRDAVERWETEGSNLIYASPEKYDASGERKLLVKRRLIVTFPKSLERLIENVLDNDSPAGASL
jgi:hypothetical protein